MSASFSVPVICAFWSGRQLGHQAAAGPLRVLAPCFHSARWHVEVSVRDNKKMEKRPGPSLPRGTEQTHSPHSRTTVVMLYLANSVALSRTRVLPPHSSSSLPVGFPLAGKPTEGTWKEQAFHCCLTTQTARPPPRHRGWLTLPLSWHIHWHIQCQSLELKLRKKEKRTDTSFTVFEFLFQPGYGS